MGIIIYDPSTPNLLRKELKRIVELAQQRARVLLPEIVVIMDCSYASSPRNFAAIAAGNPTYLHICPDLTMQPVTRIRGVLIHEMGHILQWIVRKQKWVVIPQKLKIDHEQEADFLVHQLFDVPIYYDHELVQRAGPGAKGLWPRPKGLR